MVAESDSSSCCCCCPSFSRKRTAITMLRFTTTLSCLMGSADGFTVPVQPQQQQRINPPLSSTLFDELLQTTTTTTTTTRSTTTTIRPPIDPSFLSFANNAWNFELPQSSTLNPMPPPVLSSVPPPPPDAAAAAYNRDPIPRFPSSSSKQPDEVPTNAQRPPSESARLDHHHPSNDDLLLEEPRLHISSSDNNNNDPPPQPSSFPPAASFSLAEGGAPLPPTSGTTNAADNAADNAAAASTNMMMMMTMQQQFEEAMSLRHGTVEQQNNLGSTTLSRQQHQQQQESPTSRAMNEEAGRSMIGAGSKALRRAPGRSRVTANVRETGYDSINQYLKSACNHDLLNRNEEIILGREIQILTRYEAAREALEASLERPPTYAEWAADLQVDSVATLKKQIRRSLRAKAALTESNIRLVVSIAKRYRYKGLSFQDMAQEGILGLTKACEKFDPERGFRFSTYASWWIKQSVMRAISDQGRMIRLPVHIHDRLSLLRKTERNLNMELGRDPSIEEIAQRMDMTVERVDFLRRVSVKAGSLEDSVKSSKSTGSAAGLGGADGLKVLDRVDDPESLDPNDVASYQMLRDDMSRLISTLNSREQAVVRMRYGLDDGRPKTLEEIGERFSVTRERIRQIEARALNKLRQPYRNHSVQCYVKDYS